MPNTRPTKVIVSSSSILRQPKEAKFAVYLAFASLAPFASGRMAPTSIAAVKFFVAVITSYSSLDVSTLLTVITFVQ